MDAYDIGEAVFDACPRRFRQSLVAVLAFGLVTHAGWATSAVETYIQHKTDSVVHAVTAAFKDAITPAPAPGQSPDRKG